MVVTLLLLLLFLTFHGALVANPRELLYTVANPAPGLLNRESPVATPPPHAVRTEEKARETKLSGANGDRGKSIVVSVQLTTSRIGNHDTG